MALNRQLLAKVDRRLLSGSDHDESERMVKVPVSDAVWSVWRRYCEAVGVHMGRGLAILLHHELASVADVDLEELSDRLAEREATVAAREAEIERRGQELEQRERSVAIRERRLSDVEAAGGKLDGWQAPKLGRNEPCWCGSGKKFKYCHGRTTQ
jgi:hypothetical protein